MARTFQWLPAGASVPITLSAATGYRVQDATTGLTAPPYVLPTEEYAGVDGAQVLSVTASAREVVLALLVQGSTYAQFRARTAALVRSMRPKAGPGTLIVTDEDGNSRTLSCYYTGGLEGSEARGTKRAGRWWKVTVKLLAEDPWWYGAEETIPALLEPSLGFFPILPMRLRSTTIMARAAVENLGDEESEPIWTVVGPGTAPTFVNVTTGQTLGLSTVLFAGQSLTVDTRDGFQSVTGGDGSNLFGDLETDPAMWTLAPGVNDVQISMTGASSVSSITGRYRPRYAGDV